MNDISKEESHIGVEIVNAGLNFMLNYLIGCFASVRHMSAILLLQIDMEIDDKIEYFATGSFQKAEQKMP